MFRLISYPTVPEPLSFGVSLVVMLVCYTLIRSRMDDTKSFFYGVVFGLIVTAVLFP